MNDTHTEYIMVLGTDRKMMIAVWVFVVCEFIGVYARRVL